MAELDALLGSLAGGRRAKLPEGGVSALPGVGKVLDFLAGLGEVKEVSQAPGTAGQASMVQLGTEVSAGDKQESFWLVLAGEFEVWTKRREEGEVPIKIKRPGEFFGEIVAFGGATARTATVRLKSEKGFLLQMSAARVRAAATAGNPHAVELVLSLLRAECQRVEQMDGIVAGLEARIAAGA